MGVQRVVNLAVEKTAKPDSTIYSLGPIIHNNQTLDMLKERGVEMFNEQSPPNKDSTVLIRAHGIPPKTQEKYTTGCYDIIDGTCPKVKTVHKVIEKYRKQGFSIIITGDEGHAEVIGLMGYAGDAGHLIQSIDDVKRLPDFNKICVVAQTTFSRQAFDTISNAIIAQYPKAEVAVKKTICSATDKRQKEVINLSKAVDCMIVVGGKNSANTLRLAKISQENGTPTFHIETEEEISWDSIKDHNHIGITAGASTPAWMIKRVTDHLLILNRKNNKTVPARLAQLLEVFANLNFFVAAGGVAMYYLSSTFQELPFTLTGGSIAFLYLMSIYLFNSLAVIEKNKHLDVSRYRFYNANKSKLYLLTFSCIGFLLLTSLLHNLALFLFMLLPTFAGIIYHFSIVPPPLRKYVKYSNLKDIPTSRDLFAALAWAVLVTFIPQAIANIFVITPTTIAVFLWTFYLSYLRSLIFDLRDIEGDRIMGRETLITIIGEKQVKQLIFSTLMFSFITFIGLTFLSLFPKYRFSNAPFYTFLLQLPVLSHIWLFMKWQHLLKNRLTALFNLLANGQFYIAGLGAWLISIFLYI